MREHVDRLLEAAIQLWVLRRRSLPPRWALMSEKKTGDA
jgi:hypothetical protein